MEKVAVSDSWLINALTAGINECCCCHDLFVEKGNNNGTCCPVRKHHSPKITCTKHMCFRCDRYIYTPWNNTHDNEDFDRQKLAEDRMKLTPIICEHESKSTMSFILSKMPFLKCSECEVESSKIYHLIVDFILELDRRRERLKKKLKQRTAHKNKINSYYKHPAWSPQRKKLTKSE